MTNEEILEEIKTFPPPRKRTPEEERLHEANKIENRRLLEEHLASLMTQSRNKSAG